MWKQNPLHNLSQRRMLPECLASSLLPTFNLNYEKSIPVLSVQQGKQVKGEVSFLVSVFLSSFGLGG